MTRKVHSCRTCVEKVTETFMLFHKMNPDDLSIQFTSIEFTLNHNNIHLKLLYTEGKDPAIILRKPQQFGNPL